MKKFQWLVATTGLAALAACADSDEVNMTNVEVNAADSDLALPPPDLNVDMNVDANAANDTNAVDNATDNTANNSTNSN